MALIERLVQPLDRQLAAVNLTFSPNRKTVTVDPKPTSGMAPLIKTVGRKTAANHCCRILRFLR
jgi:hypothetical protein